MKTQIASDRALLARLAEAASKKMSREEVAKQRVSYVYGNMPYEDTMTKPQVREALAMLDGEVA